MKTKFKQSLFALFSAVLLSMPAMAEGEPENVSGLSASATSENSINLSWDDAKDANGGLADHYRVYYGPLSVQTGGAEFYETEINTPNNNTSYTLTGLQSETTYYFSVTALDVDGNESSEYSIETNATTLAADTGDTLAPIVMSALALDSTHVTIKFSEKVVLPELLPEATFSINEQIIPTNTLEVLSAEIYEADPSGKFVLLETAEQSKGTNYLVTAGANVQDEAGNPIESGNTDSSLFEGSDIATEISSGEEGVEEEIEGEEESESTGIQDCGTVNENEINAETDQAVVECFEENFSACTPATYTKISGSNEEQMTYLYEVVENNQSLCRVKSMYSQHPNEDWINTEMTCEYNPIKTFTMAEKDVRDSFEADIKLGNCEGELYNTILGASGEMVESEEDTTAPEDITNLLLSFSEVAEKFMVMMDWTSSIDSAKDLMDQMLYQSLDLGVNYDGGTSLGAATNHYEVNNLEPDTEYTFKITTKDFAGNESVGVVKSIRLPQTGFGAGFLILGSGLAARKILRRRKKK